jgi:hypothetical protein
MTIDTKVIGMTMKMVPVPLSSGENKFSSPEVWLFLGDA